ncbi:unnamed protein product [Ranitomeya imitator]|uniref:GIY-YIG domain-containing protein n=1 Tax=Ranitomeya imitator TaxID=111125 RepID=A0ABN9LFQ6_9NEOB|nr:unnamed protein product [Ranitomeya imitator]
MDRTSRSTIHDHRREPDNRIHNTCYKCPPNIRDSLVKADMGGRSHDMTQSFLGKPKHSTHPCLHCNQCKKYKNFSTCDTSFVVYLIKCPCGLLYVGETTQSMRDRISKHKSTIRCKNMLLPLPYHFITQGHSISQLKFQRDFFSYIPLQSEPLYASFILIGVQE